MTFTAQPPRRRLRRWLGNVLLLLCILLTIVLAIAWSDARSSWTALTLALPKLADNNQRIFSLISHPRGIVFVTSYGFRLGPQRGIEFFTQRDDASRSHLFVIEHPGRRLLGTEFDRYTYTWPEPYPTARTTSTYIRVPHVYLLAATMLYPLLRLIRYFRRRPRPGHCPTCGYDLRASPARCPECGTPTSL